MSGALDGVIVLDVSTALAGPFGSMILGDLGADVIKIEAPGGDTTRASASTDPKSPAYALTYKGESAYFLSANRNKRSIGLDLKNAEGKKIFYEMVKKADVVYDNFRPGVNERLGIDYPKLKAVNPKIISASITGFGSTGPGKDRPAYDLVVQAMGGVMSLTGEKGRESVRCGIAIGDMAGGMFLAHGIMAALYQREKTGEGQKVETSLLSGQISLLSYFASYYFNGGLIAGPQGSAHENVVPYQSFKTKDFSIVIAAPGDNFWEKLCRMIGRDDLAKDSRFNTRNLRWENRDILMPILEATFLSRTGQEWCDLLVKYDIPGGPVANVEMALTNPQVISQNMVVEIEHSLGGKIKLAGNPIKMEKGKPEEEFSSPPILAQHTDEILKGLLGYNEERITELRNSQVVY